MIYNRIKINGKEFFIREGTYRKEKLPIQVPPFAEGEVSYSDLTDWKYWAQSDWEGGAGQKFFSETNLFDGSTTVETFKKNGEIRLHRQLHNAYDDTDADNKTPKCFSEFEGVGFAGYQDTTNTEGEVWKITRSGTTVTAAKETMAGSPIDITDLVKFDGNLYAACNDGASDVAFNRKAAGAAGNGAWSQPAAGVKFKKFAVLQDGNTGYIYGSDGLEVKSSTDGVTWTTEFTLTSDNEDINKLIVFKGRLYIGTYNRLYAYDGNILYVIAEYNDMRNAKNFEQMCVFNDLLFFFLQGKFVYEFNGAITRKLDLRRFFDEEMQYFEETPYIIPYKSRILVYGTLSSSGYGLASFLVDFIDENNLRSTISLEHRASDGTADQGGFFGILGVVGNDLYIMDRKTASLTAGGDVYCIIDWEEVNTPYQNYTDTNMAAASSTLDGGITAAATSILVAAGHGSRFADGDFLLCESELMLCTGVATDTLTVQRGVFGTTAATHATATAIYNISGDLTGNLRTSVIDGNLFTIDKYWGGITVYHEPLPANCTIGVMARIDADFSRLVSDNLTILGYNNTQGSTSFDIQILSDNIGKKIQLQVVLLTTNTSNTPIIQDIVLRYLLRPTVKHRWVFDILCMENIAEYSRPKSGKEIRQELELLENKSLVSFQDVDGKYYDANKDGSADDGIIFNSLIFTGPAKLESSKEGYSDDASTGYLASIELIEG